MLCFTFKDHYAFFCQALPLRNYIFPFTLKKNKKTIRKSQFRFSSSHSLINYFKLGVAVFFLVAAPDVNCLEMFRCYNTNTTQRLFVWGSQVVGEHAEPCFLSVSVFLQALRLSHQSRGVCSKHRAADCLDKIHQITPFKEDESWLKNTRCWLWDYLFFAQPLSPPKPISVGPQLVPIFSKQRLRVFCCFVCFRLVAQQEHVKTEGAHAGERAHFFLRRGGGISSFRPEKPVCWSDWTKAFRSPSVLPCVRRGLCFRHPDKRGISNQITQSGLGFRKPN